VYSHYIHTCFVSRFSEYIPILYKSLVENVYLILHDLSPSGNVIPDHIKLKNILCLTPWHVSYFNQQFPVLKDKTMAFSYGVDLDIFHPSLSKIPFRFIYSSFPNRGLLELLKMWPSIRKIEPLATLDLFCNLEHEWSNRVEPEKMMLIRTLLQSYLIHDDHMGIINHGWVSKKQLALAWSNAHIWFYPCTFQETFCLTALEAAASKTLVVTNHLAALKDTVGDRGVIIEGDPTGDEWKFRALSRIKEVLHDPSLFEGYIEKNREWATTLSWGSQAEKLIEMVERDRLEYKNMYNWTHDLPPNNRTEFIEIIKYFNSVFSFHHSVSVLEIGTYTGTSLIEIVRHIPNAVGVGLDVWEDYTENGQTMMVGSLEVMKSFYANVEKEGMGERISGVKSRSTEQLLSYIRQDTFFHLIYIDGSHMMCDCYSDMVLAWEILVPSGFMIIDDYLLHKDENILESPYHAVNRFLDQMNGRYALVHKGYRVALQHLS